MNRLPTRRFWTIILLTLFFSISLGCAFLSGSSTDTSNRESSQQLQDFTPEQYGKLGAYIHEHPQRTNRILRANDLSRGEFETAIRHISSHAQLSNRYEKAFREARSGGTDS